jgi:hypothetical protein
LFQYDQMTLQKIKGKLDINDFMEEKVTFKPTYKYDAGGSTFTYDVDRKHPGWTDRIL